MLLFLFNNLRARYEQVEIARDNFSTLGSFFMISVTIATTDSSAVRFLLDLTVPCARFDRISFRGLQ